MEIHPGVKFKRKVNIISLNIKENEGDNMKEKTAIIIYLILIFGSILSAIIGSIIKMNIIIVIGVIGALIAILMIPLRRFIKPFACAIGWHSYDYDRTEFDGVSVHARCQWCGYDGMIDSQGNLF